MKKITLIKKITPLLSAVCAVLALTSCDLELQRYYDFEDADTQPYTNMTVWEYINSRQDVFVYMKDAIEAADMIDVYNGGGENQTFLLIDDDGLSNTVSGGFLFTNSVPNPYYDPADSDMGPQFLTPVSFTAYPQDIVVSFLEYHSFSQRLAITDVTDELIWYETNAYKDYGDTTLMLINWTRDTATDFLFNSYDGSTSSSVEPTTSNIYCTNGVVHVFDEYFVAPTKEALDFYGVDY